MLFTKHQKAKYCDLKFIIILLYQVRQETGSNLKQKDDSPII